MGELCRHPPERGEVIDAIELGLEAPELGEILKDDERPALVGQRGPREVRSPRWVWITCSSRRTSRAPVKSRSRVTGAGSEPKMTWAAGLMKVSRPCWSQVRRPVGMAETI